MSTEPASSAEAAGRHTPRSRSRSPEGGRPAFAGGGAGDAPSEGAGAGGRAWRSARRPGGALSRGRAAGPRVGFIEDLASFGSRPAVLLGGAEVSYRELATRVEERAQALGGGRRLVLIAGSNHLEILVSYLAVLHRGHVAWLVPDASGPTTASLVSAYEPDLVVSLDADAPRIDERHGRSRHDLHPALALLLGTSGSTGTPRLVRLSHDNLQSNAESIARYLEITESDRAVTSLPLHYCYGLSVVNSHLLRGAGLILTDRSVTDRGFWSLLRERGGTSFAGVPHTFDLLDRIGFEDLELPSLRYVTQAGGRLAPATVRRYARLGALRGWDLVVMYGQTEATARIAYLPPSLAATCPEAIGVPIPGGSVEIRPVPEATDDPEVGELVYRGPNVMLGYADSPDDLALGRVVDELRTGDLGRRTPSGLLEVTGRRSRFLKLFGLRIDLQQVEHILGESGIRAICAGTDERLVVALAAGDGEAGRVGPILTERLGVPASSILVRELETIPLLPSGKPDYAAIADAPEARRGDPAPADPPQRSGSGATAVAAIFQEVLRREDVRDTDTFSGLGGDSLSFVEASIALEELLGRVPAGWPEMTVAELTRLASDGEREGGRVARMETNVVLRALAIVLVVAGHMTALWPLGGAHVLLAMAGFNFSRFQLAGTSAPHRLRRSMGTIARIAVPTSAWIGLQMLLVGGFSLGALFLVNDYVGAPEHTEGRWRYWYLEALVQILLVLVVIFSIPAVRRMQRARPFPLVLGLLAVALVLRFELIVFGEDHNRFYQPHTVVWLFLLGWAIQQATTRRRRVLVSALVLAAVPGFFGQSVRETIIVGSLLALLWAPVVLVPRPLNRIVGVVAAASLYIYLTHWQAWPLLNEVLPLQLAVVGAVAAGVGAWYVLERVVPETLRHPALRRTTARSGGSTAIAWINGGRQEARP